jgi:hypothetical protein
MSNIWKGIHEMLHTETQMFIVYYESIKREPKIRGIYECQMSIPPKYKKPLGQDRETLRQPQTNDKDFFPIFPNTPF